MGRRGKKKNPASTCRKNEQREAPGGIMASQKPYKDGQVPKEISVDFQLVDSLFSKKCIKKQPDLSSSMLVKPVVSSISVGDPRSEVRSLGSFGQLDPVEQNQSVDWLISLGILKPNTGCT